MLYSSTSWNIRILAIMSHSLLPQTKEKYESTFSSFLEWMKSKNLDVGTFSEDIFLTYFVEMSEKVTPNTLWSKYSMIKSIMDRDHSAVDMSKMTQLHIFLRNKAAGYKSKKTNVFSSDEIEKFIFTAPDDRWLAVKVVAIFGLNGACRGTELTNLTTEDVEKHGNMLLVKLTETNKKIRSFTISGDYFDIVQKYQALRPHRCWTKRFFLKYLDGKCSQQPIGKNKIASMPKLIAQYLKLPEPKLYTGYCFKRTSSKLLSNSGPSLHFVDVRPNSDWACDMPVDLIETFETESDIANSEDDSRSLSSTSDNSRLSGNHLESECNFASTGNAQPFDANQTLHIEEIRINANRIVEPVTDANARDWLHKIMNLNNCSINTINIHIHSSGKNEAR